MDERTVGVLGGGKMNESDDIKTALIYIFYRPARNDASPGCTPPQHIYRLS